jgi:penicillin G amidase
MKIFRFISSLALLFVFAYFLNTGFGSIPPLGKFLDPFNGYLQNAERENISWPEQLILDGVKGSVTVKYESRRVPHIFAENDEDLYFTVGYVNARDRLWQMDFQASIGAGKLSAIIGKNGLRIDRYLRRIGMRKGAEAALAEVNKIPELKNAIEAYTRGVNAYIESLTYQDYPVEYKLLNDKPRKWAPVRSAYVMMLLKLQLGAYQQDFENTNALKLFGREIYDDLFPDFPDGIDPIVPDTTQFGFDVLPFDTLKYNPTEYININLPFKPNPANGSNNWAVSGQKTASGYPILANDPHLGLNMPSIWYEIQMKSKNLNAYGVQIPGVPLILIGFNEQIAWGETNSNRDYMDWYHIEYDKESQGKYKYDGQWMDLQMQVEEINIKGEGVFYDTVWFTHYGPVVFDHSFMGDSTKTGYVMRWQGSDPSNEMFCFYKLNRAGNYDEYREALRSFFFPAQNVIFSSKSGDIALWQHGKFVLKDWGQGKFILDGSDPAQQWNEFIPLDQDPHYKNPARQFVSSANQHPAGKNYPYYYNGNFEFYRNRRINRKLENMDQITPEDMMKLQNDNYALKAAENLPYILSVLKQKTWNEEGESLIDLLEQWDYGYGIDAKAPAVFEIFWYELKEIANDEADFYDVKIPYPKNFVFAKLMRENTDHPYFDIQSTEKVEHAEDVITLAFEAAMDSLDNWKSIHGPDYSWAGFKGAQLTHLLRKVKPFDITNIPIGGGNEIVNASKKTHGPSWRMIVSLGDPVVAYGVYPGGQSGNPGSPHYAEFVSNWAKGKYYTLQFLKTPEEENDKIVFTQKLTGK